MAEGCIKRSNCFYFNICFNRLFHLHKTKLYKPLNLGHACLHLNVILCAFNRDGRMCGSAAFVVCIYGNRIMIWNLGFQRDGAIILYIVRQIIKFLMLFSGAFLVILTATMIIRHFGVMESRVTA